MASKTVTKISDKLIKVDEDFRVFMYDNGFMFEISGRDSDDDYKNMKILCNTLEELQALVVEAAETEKDN